MNLGDKAREAPEVDLARQSAPGAYRLQTDELVPAAELTPEGEFPEYGDFLKVKRVARDDGDLVDRDEQFIECPQGLASWLVENIEVGDCFHIQSVQKVDGTWQYDVAVLEE